MYINNKKWKEIRSSTKIKIQKYTIKRIQFIFLSLITSFEQNDSDDYLDKVWLFRLEGNRWKELLSHTIEGNVIIDFPKKYWKRTKQVTLCDYGNMSNFKKIKNVNLIDNCPYQEIEPPDAPSDSDNISIQGSYGIYEINIGIEGVGNYIVFFEFGVPTGGYHGCNHGTGGYYLIKQVYKINNGYLKKVDEGVASWWDEKFSPPNNKDSYSVLTSFKYMLYPPFSESFEKISIERLKNTYIAYRNFILFYEWLPEFKASRVLNNFSDKIFLRGCSDFPFKNLFKYR